MNNTIESFENTRKELSKFNLEKAEDELNLIKQKLSADTSSLTLEEIKDLNNKGLSITNDINKFKMFNLLFNK